MKIKSSWAGFFAAGVLAGLGGMAQAVLLHTRDGNPATGEADYDAAPALAWLDNSNHTETSSYSGSSVMIWTPAHSRAPELNPEGSVITSGRLPTIVDVDSEGTTFTNVNQVMHYGSIITTRAEMPHMWHTTFGAKAYDDIEGTDDQGGLSLTGASPFSSFQSNFYWLTAEDYTPGTGFVSQFGSDSSSRSSTLDSLRLPAWAVSCGVVGAAMLKRGTATVWVMRRGLEKWSKVAHWVSIMGVRSRRFPALHP